MVDWYAKTALTVIAVCLLALTGQEASRPAQTLVHGFPGRIGTMRWCACLYLCAFDA